MPSIPSAGMPSVLRVDGRADPLGIGNPRPRFTWVPAVGQSAAEVVVSASRSFDEVLWSGEVAHDYPGLEYTGPPLRSRDRRHWRVRVRSADGQWGPWSETASFECGLLRADDWSATWITDGPEVARRQAPTRALYFRSTVRLPEDIVRARAYVSALGWYRLHLGDRDITGDALVPRWTPLDDEVEYQVYDVTDAVTAGRNEIGVSVGDGRYRGHLGYVDRRAVYGTRLAALVQLEVYTGDGARHTFVSDETWTVGAGRIRTADPIHGERVDLRISGTDWMRPGHGPAGSTPAVPHVAHTSRSLIAEDVDRVQVVATRHGQVRRSATGTQIVDFGQNLSGTVRVRLPAGAGRVVTLLYGEVLDGRGALNTVYLSERKPKEWFQRDEVTLGAEPMEFQSTFAVRGFRYVEIDGLDVELTDGDVEAREITTPMRPTGEFDCSDERLNRLWLNARWSMTSNFLDTATDCPTRERSGWTGEAQVFGPTAALLFDVRAFEARYLHNVALEQHSDGRIPPYIPSEVSALLQKNPKDRWTLSSAGWSDVTVLLPWSLYTAYGDPRVLRDQYASAQAWVGYLERAARRRGLRPRGGRRVGDRERYIVDTGFHFGEWLRPGEVGMKVHLGNLLRVPAVVATAYFAHSARTLSDIAGVLGETADETRYRALADRVREAWHAAFVSEGGARIGADRQDDYVRALALHLLPDEEENRALARLVELIAANGFHLDTGFLSTPMLLSTLCEHGRADVAYRLLLQDTAPSWLYEVRMGATSIWEKWDGNDEDGNADQSQNHYAHGNVAAFLHRYVAGLRPAAPGWRRIVVEPFIGGGLTHARSRVETPYGTAESAWRLDADELVLDVTVPPGTDARLRVGTAEEETLPAGRHRRLFARESVLSSGHDR